MGLGEVVELVFARIDAARRDRVQQWLPEMRASAIYQGYLRAPPAAEAIAEAGDKFQPRRAAADHDNAVQLVLRSAVGRKHRHCLGGSRGAGGGTGPTMRDLGHPLHSG